MTQGEEIKALPVLLRHSPGTMLPGGTYVIDGEAVRSLRAAGVAFREIAREATSPEWERLVPGRRV